MKRWGVLGVLLAAIACGPVKPPASQPRTVTVKVLDESGSSVEGAHVLLDASDPTGTHEAGSDVNGNAVMPQVPALWVNAQLTITKDGCDKFGASVVLVEGDTVLHETVKCFPPPPSRDQILAAHESFQGSVLHTEQFGDLNWWPTAWTSLNDTDRAASYAQIASWGDTDITVSISWDYGEPNQPYGSGQLVPPTDLTSDLPRFRSLVKEVVRHGFIPTVFMAGDNGFSYYMWVMPLIMQALHSQPGDEVDLTQYVKLRMCYDSCVPGYAGAADDKSIINDAILATRSACPNCVIALEFATGYSSTGDGDAWWHSEAGQAIDEADWEGNTWTPNNWEQYWQILDRWLGPAYIRPVAQASDPTAPFGPDKPQWYLRGGTPRGPYGVHCLEPFTYQWVRGQVPRVQVPVAYKTLAGLGCSAIDLPTR